MESPGDIRTTQAHLSKYFDKAEARFITLVEMDDLDERIYSNASLAHDFGQALNFALQSAFSGAADNYLSHLFLQRVLYRINRLKFFWYDDLSNYKNEDSDYLRQVQHRIESAWKPWEISQLAVKPSGEEEDNVSDALRRRIPKLILHCCEETVSSLDYYATLQTLLG